MHEKLGISRMPDLVIDEGSMSSERMWMENFVFPLMDVCGIIIVERSEPSVGSWMENFVLLFFPMFGCL